MPYAVYRSIRAYTLHTAYRILHTGAAVNRHFTATAFIVDSKRRTLLLWHKRLNRWMPPGGHVAENETPEETACRECKEETGLDVEIVGDGSTELGVGVQGDLFANNPSEGKMLKKPIAMLLEEIPESVERGEPAHQHMDFLFLARPLDETQAPSLNHNESREMRWFTREEVKKLNDRTEIFSNVKKYILSTL
jgi:8-oxo-dGTP pyrophosphatase MutT (NUDIX family)